jgi:hypothetical protein
MKWLAIINPMAGATPQEKLEGIVHQLARRLGADLAWTSYRGHARTLAQNSREYDGAIAMYRCQDERDPKSRLLP